MGHVSAELRSIPFALEILMKRLHEEAGIRHFHMSGKRVLASKMEYRKENVPGLPAFSEFEIWQTDGEKVAQAAEILKMMQL